uniref:Uncharacterized protein n=1 Tax=Glycine max TaxID=3847 RepID=C6TBU0_SOYBN|nr:unknown [Glycine max]
MEAPPATLAATRTLWQCHKRRKVALEASLRRTEGAVIYYLIFVLPVFFSQMHALLSCPLRFQPLDLMEYFMSGSSGSTYLQNYMIHFGSVTGQVQFVN